MKGLSDYERSWEEDFGLMSGWYVFVLWEISTAAGSKWEYDNSETMEIIVNKSNAYAVYGCCKEIRSGFSVGISKNNMKKIKQARKEAHQILFDEANDPNTPIERKIALVKLTSK